jgi:L-amino acid N-acyltransferase YncA
MRPADPDVLGRLRAWAGRSTAQMGRLVAEDESGALVGFVVIGAAEGRDERTAEVYALEIAQDHWGCGAGCDLLATAMDRLSRAGFDRAVLWIDAANRGARRFYERHGWSDDALDRQVTGPDPHGREARYSRSLV